MNLKKCTKCKVEFPDTTEFFHKSGTRLHTHCKTCKNNDGKKYQTRYKDKYKDKKAQYREKNKEKIQAWHKENYKQNADKINTKGKEYYRKNSNSICARTKKYREDNADWYRDYKREYRKNPINKLRSNISRGVWGCLSGQQKTSSTFKYIGCTVEELWTHLESQFTEGMTRDNYGEWHVDHIKPIASFDFDSNLESELHKAWHYSNLQPLWAKDNLSKGKKERMNG